MSFQNVGTTLADNLESGVRTSCSQLRVGHGRSGQLVRDNVPDTDGKPWTLVQVHATFGW